MLLYAYVSGNPMVLIDPLGLAWYNPWTWGCENKKWRDMMAQNQQMLNDFHQRSVDNGNMSEEEARRRAFDQRIMLENTMDQLKLAELDGKIKTLETARDGAVEVGVAVATGGIVTAVRRGAQAVDKTADVSLNVLNRNFTPDAGKVLQNITTQQVDHLASNPSLARSALTKAQYEAGQTSERVARMNYGHAVETMVGREVRRDAMHSQILRWNGGGRGPDFFGVGPGNAGRIFDITTPSGIASHSRRAYGAALEYATYTRPAGFHVFP